MRLNKNKEMLLTALTNPDWRARSQSVEELAKMRDDELSEVLIEVVREHHNDLSVLNAAIELLSRPGRSFFPGLVQLAHDEDAEVRTYSILALSLIGEERAVPVLLEALDDPEKNVQFVAIEGLGRMHALESVGRLMEILHGDDYFLKFPAIHALAAIGSPEPAHALLQMLEDEVLVDPIINALGIIGGDESVPAICRYLETPGADATITATALVSIYQRSTNPEGTRKLILSQLTPLGRYRLANEVPDSPPVEATSEEQHEYADLAVVMKWLVMEFPEEEAACQALMKLLNFPGARRKALDGLDACAARVLPILASVLEDPDQNLRQSAMRLFTNNAQHGDIPMLEEALQSEYPEIVALAAEGMGRLGDYSVYEMLLPKLGHPVAYVRQVVLEALEELQHPDHTQHMLNLLDNNNASLREIAVGALSRQNLKDYSGRILAALADPAEVVRRAVVEALPYLDDPQALFTLEEAAYSEDTGIRISAVKALAYCQSSFALPLLHDALEDENYWVRINATRALARHNDPESISLIVRCLTDPMPPVRIAAMEALVEMDGETVMPLLMPMVKDSNHDVSKVAQRLIDQMGESLHSKKTNSS
jgi:HEAT repeat protein